MHEVERGGVDAGWRFDNSYARLPAALFSRLGPVPVRRPGIAVLNEALADPVIIDGLPVIRVEPLIYMKLVASRRQDLADVVSLLQEGDVDVARTRALLDKAAPALRARFEELLAEADAAR